jgi:hypothetical protein
MAKYRVLRRIQGEASEPPPEKRRKDGTLKRTKDRLTRQPAKLYDGKRILRVFPERTAMTADDDHVYIGHPQLSCCMPQDVDEVHISVVFTWHKEFAEQQLLPEWDAAYPGKVKIGGPAYESIERPAGDFAGSKYLKSGVTITSRGCPNRCWFCFVPKREGVIREMPIVPGFHLQDNNLTACSRGHCENVFKMLAEQKEKINFSGGLECARILSHSWFVDLLVDLKKHIRQIFVAYDDVARDNVTRKGLALLTEKGFTRRQLRCFVLAGYPANESRGIEADTINGAVSRCEQVWDWGGLPFMMLYRDENFSTPYSPRWKVVQHETSGPWGDPQWRSIQNQWTAPAVMFSNHGEEIAAEDKDDEDVGLIPGDCQPLVEEDEKTAAEMLAEKRKKDEQAKKLRQLEEAGQENMFGGTNGVTENVS